MLRLVADEIPWDVSADSVTIESASSSESIPTRNVLWAAGVAASPLARRLAMATKQEVDKAGRIPVTSRLTVADCDNIFAIGDLAAAHDENNELLPGVAPVAIQQGKYVADVIKQRIVGNVTCDAFRYRDLGSMATIGRAAAIAKIGRFRFHGLFAWILWLVVHLVQIMEVPNRLLILIQWAWNYLTFNRASRIITGTHAQLSLASVQDSDQPEEPMRGRDQEHLVEPEGQRPAVIESTA